MNGFTDGMNSAGEAFVLFAIRMLMQSSVLILILLALDLVLRKRVRAVVRYWIWLLVLAKLLLPPSLSAPTSLAWWLGDSLPQAPTAFVDAAAEREKKLPPSRLTPQTTSSEIAATPTALGPVAPSATAVASDAKEAASSAQAAPAPAALIWQALVLAAWLIVVAGMLVLLVQRAVFVRGLVRQSQDAPEPLCDLLDRCRRQMRVHTPVRLRLTCLSASPSVCGLVRPTILVPQRMLSQLNGGQWKSILLHELAHIRRADLWVNLAQTLLQIAYVYHPLVWLANAIIRRVREQAVDETVLAAMGDEAEEYPRTLLTVSKLAFDHSALSLRLIAVVESKKMLIARIRHIVSRPFPTSARLGFAGVLLVLAAGALLLPMAKAGPDAPIADDSLPVPTTSSPPPGPTGTTISGMVVDAAGKPVADAYVSVENTDLLVLTEPKKFGSQMRKVMRANDTRTDLQGHFRINDLNPGSTGITVWASGYRTESVPDVVTGAEGLRIVLGEPRPYQLSGVVVDDSGKGIPDAEVMFVEEIMSRPRNESEQSPVTRRTDATGAFHFDRVLLPTDVESVSRLLLARKPGYGVTGEYVDRTGGKPFARIILSPEERVSGTVNDTGGRPVAGAVVTLHCCFGQRNTFWFPPAFRHLSPQAVTDANGSFTLSQIPTESDIFLGVQAPGYAPGDLRSVRTGRFGYYAMQRGSGWAIMGNTGDPNAPLVITLQKAVTLRGTVVYEGTGQPAGAVPVFTQPTERGNGSEAVTGTAGRFEMTDVSPAPCNLMVMMESPVRDIAPEWTASAVRLSDLKPGETRDGIQLVLTKGDIIRGKATDSQGHPLKGIDIAFYSAARPRSGAGAACQAILTAADGTWAYRFPPGEVYIYIRTNIAGANWDRKAYAYDLTAGQTIENADFVLNQAVPEGSPYRGVSPATETPAAPPRQ